MMVSKNMKKQRTDEITHKIMSSIPSANTTPELKLRKELFARGYRYRTNYKKLTGKPDIVFTKAKLAIFVDGDFWHGHNWAIRGYGSHEEEMKRYSQYWQDKINKNIERDRKVDEILQNDGWIVLRFWESDIKSNLEYCLKTIEIWYAIMTGSQ